MPRMQYKIYRQQNRRRRIRRILLSVALLVIGCGLLSRLNAGDALSAEPLLSPTATPIARAFDETPVSREINLPADAWYALQTGVYSDAQKAAQTAELYTERGAPGYILESGGKYRVLIACYSTEEDAQRVCDRLHDRQSVETYVYPWLSEEVTLRLSGMAGQVDIAEAGLTLLTQTPAQLRDLATLCDSAETDYDGALASLNALRDQLALWENTLRARFDKPYPALVTEMLDASDTIAASLRQISASPSVTALSAQLKLQSMALYQRMQALRAFLLGL